MDSSSVDGRSFRFSKAPRVKTPVSAPTSTPTPGRVEPAVDARKRPAPLSFTPQDVTVDSPALQSDPVPKRPRTDATERFTGSPPLVTPNSKVNETTNEHSQAIVDARPAPIEPAAPTVVEADSGSKALTVVSQKGSSSLKKAAEPIRAEQPGKSAPVKAAQPKSIAPQQPAPVYRKTSGPTRRSVAAAPNDYNDILRQQAELAGREQALLASQALQIKELVRLYRSSRL